MTVDEQNEITLLPASAGEWRIEITGGWAKGLSLDTVCFDTPGDDALLKAYHLAKDGCRITDDGNHGANGFPAGTTLFVRAAQACGIVVKVNRKGD